VVSAVSQGPDAFVISNPWDAGSARILAGLGFQALATSSGACAGILGRRDGQVTRDEALAHAHAIAAATDLPVSADLEKGFGDAPAAAAQAARALPFAFTLTARAEAFLRGHPSLDDTIRRLQAYEKAGADVLFAPGLPDLAAVRAVCAAVSKPVNFMAGIRGKSFTVAELTAAGVRRISLATSLYRAAMSGLLEAAREVKDRGTFGYLDRSLTTPEVNAFMQG
jgi:2-methylisocitrate lyase-like PEP mutase family enzyme